MRSPELEAEIREALQVLRDLLDRLGPPCDCCQDAEAPAQDPGAPEDPEPEPDPPAEPAPEPDQNEPPPVVDAPDADEPADPPSGLYVSPGDDLQAAARAAIASGERRLVLRDGVYPRFALNDLPTKASARLWIRAQNPGGAVVSDLATSLTWKSHGDNLFSAPFKGDCWGGSVEVSGTSYFLLRCRSLADLRADRIRLRRTWETFDRSPRKPPYGLAIENGRIYLRTPPGGDPKNASICASAGRPLVSVVNSPGVIIDGVDLAGAGDSCGVEASNSPNLTVRNAKITHCRRGARLDDDSVIEWCHYTYPGFERFCRDVVDLNDGDVYSIFDFVKNYHHASNNRGNALLEGGLASSPARASRNCTFRHNLIEWVWDGEQLGQFVDSISHHSIYRYCIDNAVQMESWRSGHPGSNLRMADFLVLNCAFGPLSVQDKGGQIKGPQYIYRGVVANPDPVFGSAPYQIKSMITGSPDVRISQVMFHVPSGKTNGYGKRWVWFDQSKGRSYVMKMRNCILLAERLDDDGGTANPDIDHCLLVSRADNVKARGARGHYMPWTPLEKFFPGWAENDYRPAVDLPAGAALDAAKWGASSTDMGAFSRNADSNAWPRLVDRYSAEPPVGF